MTALRRLLLVWFVLALPAWAQEDPIDPAPVTDALPDTVHPAWADFEPEFHPYICPFAGNRVYDPEEFRCGYVKVPEDRTDPGSRLIRLSVLKIRSTSETTPAGAMIRLTGGPGGPSLGAGRITAYQGPGTARIRATADLIFFDQRGVGYSDGEFCRAVAMPYQTGLPTQTGGQDAFDAEIARCFEEARASGMSIEGYTNWQNALDVRDIRLALGYDQWTLFGVSYGTELGQGVMQVDPDGVRAAILDSVVPTGYTTNDLNGMYAAGFRSALDALNAMCSADPDCAAAYPDLAQSFIDAIAAYDDDPLQLTGVQYSRAEAGEIHIDGVMAAAALFQALYNNSVYASLPALLRVLETRDEVALRAYIDELGYVIDHDYGHGISITINCRGGFRTAPDAPPPHGDPQPQLSQWMATTGFHANCSRVFSTEPDPTVTPLVSDIPTLVVTGDADPITPPYYADEVLPGLANAQRVDFRYTGHGALLSHWSDCGQDILVDFLTTPTAPVDAACAGNVAVPDFQVNLRETKAPLRLARGLQANHWPIGVLAAAAGLLTILAAFPLTILARRIDSQRSADYGRARVFAWAGGALSLIGLMLAVRTILDTGTQHPASLVVGVPSSIATAGWVALAGFLVCLFGVFQLVRTLAQPGQRVGTRLAILIAALLSGWILWFLFSIDAGPFMF